ncbi:MAG TPA: hypothetical protein VNW95_06860 [Mucilaginibacter sp.]|jgi:hypothetical protein|nr:hypothetical protein [Mucilaginibacter sp.]
MKTHLYAKGMGTLRLSFVILIVIIAAGILTPRTGFSQNAKSAGGDSTRVKQNVDVKPTTYPKVVGYLSFILPIVTIDENSTTTNFSKGTFSIGFPVGVNVLYSDKFGFSYEFTPTIKSSGGTSKMSNLLFDPGTMFRFEHGFTIITRLAFETSGRYGFTPVFNKVYLHTRDVNYFVALSTPARFGNGLPASVGLNVQFGFIFN